MNSIFRNKYIELYLVPLIGGMLYATGFPMTFMPTNFLGPILGLAMLFYALPFSNEEMKGSSWKVEFLSVISFCLGYNLLGYYWIPQTIKVFGGIPFPFNHTLGVLFSLIIAPQIILFVVSHRVIKRFSFKTSSLISSISKRNMAYALGFTLLEYFTPQQFPAHAGHSWLTVAPYLGLAKVFGAPLFSFINVWLSLAIVSKLRRKQNDFLAPIAFLIVLILNIIFPLKHSPDESYTKQNIRLVQANIGNFLKIASENGTSPNSFEDVRSSYLKLSTENISSPLDLIIWPETAYPRLLPSEMMKINVYTVPSLIRNVVRITKAELFTGGYDRSTSQTNNTFFETEYNSAFHFGEDGKLKDVFHKMKLIPFGESLPFGPLNKYLAKVIDNISYFAKGEEYTLFKTRSDTPFISAICYEILFSSFIRTYLNSTNGEADFIINLTNDSWYGKTAEPFQHLFLTKWRAIEFDIPVIRSTNTGLTSIIYPDGSESERTKLFQVDTKDIELFTKTRTKTFFQKYWLLGLFLFWGAFNLLETCIIKFKSKKEN